MGLIKVNKIRVYAHHGCLPEETRIGSYYEIDVVLDTDFSLASEKDDLNATIDYVQVREIVEREMKIPSKLIEHVALRIKESMTKEIKKSHSSTVTVTKFNAPMGGEVESVSVTL